MWGRVAGERRENLLVEHLIEQRHEPLLEFAIVFIGHQHVADAVQALVKTPQSHTLPKSVVPALDKRDAARTHAARKRSLREQKNHLQSQRLAIELEAATDARVQRVARAEISRGEALDNVLLDAARRRNNDVDHLVLAQVANRFAHAARRHIACVSQEDGGLDLFARFWVFELIVLVLCHRLVVEGPRTHLVDLLDGHAKVGGLEATGQEAAEQCVVVDAVVKVVSFYFDATFWHFHRFDQDRIGSRSRDRRHCARAVCGPQGGGHRRGGGCETHCGESG